MSTETAPIFGMRLGVSSWPTALIGIVLIKAVLSFAVEPGSFVVSYSGISYLVLLVLATCFAIRNSIQNTLGGRLFWAVLAIAYGLWSAHQALDLHYELGLRIEVPDKSIADSLLFLHLGVLGAAVATLPHRDVSNRRQNAPVANALFVTFLWIFVYGYAVFPYQYLFSSGTSFSYALRFDIWYLLENLAVILTVGVLAFRVKAPWKPVYLHLLAASTLYALSSTVTNLAVDSGGYVNGKLYGLGLTASVCWFLWIPLSARQVPSVGVKATPFDGGKSSQVSVWAMIVVVMVSIPIVWELFQRNENSGPRTFRVVFAVVMIVCLSSAAYIKEHLAKRELASQAQAALQEGEERLRSVFDYSAIGMALVGNDGRWIRVNKALCEILGYSEQELLSTNFQSLTHPDDLDADLSYAQKVFSGKRHVYHLEKRYIHRQGHVVWVTLTASAVPDASGKVSYGIAQVQDITARKNAEAALRRHQEELQNLAGRLITVQEEERKRIARDLHDDINQRIALLTFNLERVKADISTSKERAKRGISETCEYLREIGIDIQALSHRLHSSRLEYLGLEAAAAGFCKELSGQQNVDVEFHSENISKTLNTEVSLCLFRVLQEALQNAVKYSGVRQFRVSLKGTSDQIELSVHDSGVGFDPEKAINGHGLGLTSMKERLRLVDGRLLIDTQPQHGTTINARVPLSLEIVASATVDSFRRTQVN